METKRLILAVALSVCIFLGWNFLAQRMGWLPAPPDSAVRTAPKQDATAADARGMAGQLDGDAGKIAADPDPSSFQLAAFIPTEGRLVTVDTPLYKAVLHSAGGTLRKFELKRYRTGLMEGAPLVNIVSDLAAGQAPLGLLVDGVPTWTGLSWALDGEDLFLDADGSGVLRFSAETGGMRIIRELRFDGATYVITESLRLVSPVETKTVKVAFTFGATALSSDEKPSVFSRLRHAFFGGEEPVVSESQYNPTRIAWLQNGSFSEENAGSTLEEGKLVQGRVSWMAVMNNYFMGAVSMDDETSSAKGRWTNSLFHVLIGKTGVTVAPGRDAAVECSYFLGPKESKLLESTPNHLDRALDYGFFSVVAKPLVFLLQFLYSYVHNYGLAIIFMTILIKLIFWPLSQKSYKSMQQMKQLQPMMAKIREKHAGDKEALNREIMQLYKTYKVNPAGGCLPILVQIPVFFGLYQALLNAIELRHAPFISTLPFTDLPWLADLASPDPYLITPLVMGATMFLQQKITPAPGDPTQAKVMMFMPLIFTVLFLGFPSGLVVYWLVNNVISIGQQWSQLRRTAADAR
jgi:YidC/Oxa1 family membrane protein insertase